MGEYNGAKTHIFIIFWAFLLNGQSGATERWHEKFFARTSCSVIEFSINNSCLCHMKFKVSLNPPWKNQILSYFDNFFQTAARGPKRCRIELKIISEDSPWATASDKIKNRRPIIWQKYDPYFIPSLGGTAFDYNNRQIKRMIMINTPKSPQKSTESLVYEKHFCIFSTNIIIVKNVIFLENEHSSISFLWFIS